MQLISIEYIGSTKHKTYTITVLYVHKIPAIYMFNRDHKGSVLFFPEVKANFVCVTFLLTLFLTFRHKLQVHKAKVFLINLIIYSSKFINMIDLVHIYDMSNFLDQIESIIL